MIVGYTLNGRRITFEDRDELKEYQRNAEGTEKIGRAEEIKEENNIEDRSYDDEER